MNTNWKAAVTIGFAVAAGVGVTYGALYFRAMHPQIQKPERAKKKIACVGDSLTEQHEEWFVDGVHFNRQGTDAVAGAVLEAIRQQK